MQDLLAISTHLIQLQQWNQAMEQTVLTMESVRRHASHRIQSSKVLHDNDQIRIGSKAGAKVSSEALLQASAEMEHSIGDYARFLDGSEQ